MSYPLHIGGTTPNFVQNIGIRAAIAPLAVANAFSRADDWAAAFLKEAKRTPFDRIRDNILARHHFTKEQFAALPKNERESIEQEIREAIKRVLAAG